MENDKKKDEDRFRKEVAERLDLFLLKTKELSQIETSKLTKIDKGSLNYYLQGTRTMSIYQMHLFARKFQDLDLNSLFRGKPLYPENSNVGMVREPDGGCKEKLAELTDEVLQLNREKRALEKEVEQLKKAKRS